MTDNKKKLKKRVRELERITMDLHNDICSLVESVDDLLPRVVGLEVAFLRDVPPIENQSERVTVIGYISAVHDDGGQTITIVVNEHPLVEALDDAEWFSRKMAIHFVPVVED